jgi:hypothetical protein
MERDDRERKRGKVGHAILFSVLRPKALGVSFGTGIGCPRGAALRSQ